MPAATRARFEDAGERVRLEVRASVFAKGEVVRHVHFPIDGVVSNVFEMSDGAQVEVGIVGREGMTGFPLVLTGARASNSLYAQIAGTSLKVPGAAVIAVVDATAKTRRQFMHYVEAQFSALSQYSACNRLHSLEERFARWLLMAHDRLPADEIPLTQEFLSLMLGVRRAGVSVAASTFQRAGLISYTRGLIVVLDRVALQSASCECYDAVEERFEALLGYSIRKLVLPGNES